jgi:putative ABC transport system substrate-binding protein
MRRREVILGMGAAVAGASSSIAQSRPASRVGVLFPGGGAAMNLRMQAFREGVFPAGRNDPDIEIVARAAEGNPGRLPALASELVRSDVRAILAVSPAAVRAARGATATVPIVAHDLNRTRSRMAGRQASPGPAGMSPAYSSIFRTSA